MNINRFFIFVSALALFLAFSACEKKTTEPTPSPEDAAEKVSQANQILVPRIILLVNSGGADTSAFNVSAAASLYNEALAADPNNRDAHFGLALTDILSLGSDAQVRELFSENRLIITPAAMKAFLGRESSPSQPLSGLSSQLRDRIFSAPRQMFSSALGKRTADDADHRLPSFYQNIIEAAVIPKLASAIDHLIFVTQDPNYAFLVTPQMTGGTTTETYRIDLTEIYLLLALLQVLNGDASAFVAYNIDYNSADSAFVHTAWQVSSAFLAFRTNGGQRMRDARTYFVGMATSIQAGLNYLMNEPPHTETDIIRYNPNDAPTFQSVIAILDTVKLVLSGPYTPSGGPTINLRNFFDDAIPNYKQLLPSYSAGAQFNQFSMRYDAVIMWQAATFNAWIFPDPTLRGLFPGMTDAGLKQLFGLTSSGYSQTTIIPG